jgi:hypothetical protein
MHEYMHVFGVFDVFEVICISNFKIQGKKEKKENEAGPLQCVRTWQRTFGHISVCIHTVKGPRGAHLCFLVACWCAWQGLCRACWWAAHGKGWTGAHGKANMHGRKVGPMAKNGCTTERCDSRQRRWARQRDATHDKGRGARQCLCRAVLARCTAKTTLPSQILLCGVV